ncbi:MAG TPA: rhomboid family intramembrane serine protease [Thiotrichales bacterium]|nr:rhomboid family intramembrane serine protease [Thiotrichales bacterium]
MIPLHDDNPTELPPILTVTLIVVCVLVFLWQLGLGRAGQAAVYAFGVVPAVLFDKAALPPELALIPPELTLITSMFLHGGWMHLLGNMLYLWIFGNNVEDAMGHGRFLFFYLACGVMASLIHAMLAADSTLPMIGASGAISGVLGAYLLLYPHARVLVGIPLGFFLYTVSMPAGWVLALWFLMQFIGMSGAQPGAGGVAWMAHIGGFLVGMALVPFLKREEVPLFHPAQKRVARRRDDPWP